MKRISWDNYFLQIANIIKVKSPDTHRQVGCVLVSANNRILSTGYNGLVANSNDDINWNDRDFVHSHVIHAETNCLLYAPPPAPQQGPCKLYITISPCCECIKLIASYNIKQVYFEEKYKDFENVQNKCKFYNIELIKI
jgi:dCMP deaminase